MSVRKVYQALQFLVFDTYVVVNGNRTLIQFRGGSMKPSVNGKFVTDDPAVIQALDSAGGNGIDFKCIAAENVRDPDPKLKAKLSVSVLQTTQPSDTPPVYGGGPVTEVPGIKIVQKAKDWLLEKFPELKASQLQNGPAVKKEAADRNIKFVDLP